MRLPLLFLASAPIVATALLGCNEVALRAAPDAGNPCLAPVLEYACHPQAATLPGCSPDLDSGGAPFYQEEVLDGGSFPSGCTVIVYSKLPDLDRQCSQLGTCVCNGDDAGPYGWTCRQ